MAITKTQSGKGVQTAQGTNCSVALGFTAVAGRLLLSSVGVREGITATGRNGWTIIGQGNAGETGALLYRVATGGETTVDFTGSGNVVNLGAVSAEFSNADATGAVGSGSTAGAGGGTDLAPARTPTAGASCVVVGAFASTGFDSAYSGATSGFTFVDSQIAGNGDNPVVGLVYQIIASASGSYTPGITGRNQSVAVASGVFYEPAVDNRVLTVLLGGL